MARRFRWLGILALVLVPIGGNSLGLGEIKLDSYLNERLDAEIFLSLSPADELSTLQVGVAPRAEFDRVGIDRPIFLDDLVFVVEPVSASSARVRVTSSRPIVEPFVTFLIEAKWSGGRLIREYTVLLDPPTFLPTPEAPAVAAPQPATESPTGGVVRRPAPAPQIRPAESGSPSGAMPTRYGPVRRAETLWSIAQSLRPDESVSVNQMMLALFRANPDAFDGNINHMRAGAVLRVPSREDVTGVTRGEATAEVRRQNTRWKGATPRGPAAGTVARDQAAGGRAPSDEPRLELVPPTEAEVPAAGEAAPLAGIVAEQEALNEELLNAVQSLRRELEETQLSIDIKDAEIAALQSRLGQLESSRGAGPDMLAADTGEPPPGVESPAAGTPAATTDQTATPAPVAPAATTPAPAVQPPAAALSRPTADTGGLLSSMWLWIVAAVVVLSALFFVWRRRQETETETYEAWAPTPSASPESAAAESAIVVEEGPRQTVTAPATPEVEAAAAEALSEPEKFAGLDETGMLESLAPAGPAAEEPEQDILQAPAPDAEATGTDYQYPFEDTIAGATGINLEQSDPLAEADFHMAYGLYDQAADLIRKAIDREPDRHDLRLKMLDILFVWGKKDEFVAEVHALKGVGDVEPSDWSRVAIMGRQIAPEDAIFEGDQATMSIDLAVAGDDLQSGLTAVGGALDFDLATEPGGGSADSGGDVLDFDLGATGELPGLAAVDTTQRQSVAPDQTAELEIEDLGLDLDLESLTADNEIVEPTVLDEETIAQTIEASPQGLPEAMAETMEAPRQDTPEAMAETMEAPRQDTPDAMAETMEAPRPVKDDQTGITEMIAQAEELLLDEEGADTGVLVDDGSDTGILRDGSTDTEVLEKVGREDGETGITEMLEEIDESRDDLSGVFVADDLQTEFEGVDQQTGRLERPAEDDTSALRLPVDDDTGEMRAALGDDTGEMTAIAESGTDQLPALGAVADASNTAQIKAMEDPDPDLDLDDLTRALGVDLEPTAEMQAASEAPDGETLIEEVFGADDETRVAPGRDVLLGQDDDATREMPRVDVSEVTLSEVGTKLDLARAYIDMGDPDGARNILEEVIEEGNDTQKGEAQDLLQGMG